MDNVFSLSDVRSAKAAARGGATTEKPQMFRSSPWAAENFKDLHSALYTLAGMVRGGLLTVPETVGTILTVYGDHARRCEMKAAATLSRAVKAERRVRWLERRAKSKAKVARS